MNSNSINSPAAQAMSLKSKVFFLTSLLTVVLVCLITASELSRWKELSRSYIESKGMTLVRTISPLIREFIGNNDIPRITRLAKSLTSREIYNNDVISVQISDASKKKLAEAAPDVKYRQSYYFYLPPTVVIENPLVDPESDKELGFIQIVFSNEYFVNKTSEVLNLAIISMLLGIAFAYYISNIVVKHIEKPIAQMVDIAEKISEGNMSPEINIENSKECRQLGLAFSNMVARINDKSKNINYKNSLLERKVYEMTALKQVNHSFNSVRDLNKIYMRLVDNILNILSGMQTCMLLEVDEINNEFEYKIIKGLNIDSTIEEHKRVPIDSIIASKVYQTGESLILNETAKKPSTIDTSEGGLPPTSTIDKSFYMPVIVNGKVTAVVFGKNKLSGEDFSEDDLRLIEGIINETSIAIKNSITWQNLNSKVLELNTLHEIAKNLGTVLDINKLLEMILDHTAKVFGGVKTSSIILYDAETELLNVKLYKGEKSNRAMKPIKSGEGIAGKVFQRGEPIIINDMLTSSNDSVDSGSSSICVPLKVKEKCLGVLSITDKLSGEPFDKSDLDMMVTLASQISISLNNAKLYEDLEASYLSAVRALANSIDAKDAYTMGHSERVAKYSVEIGKKLNLTEEESKNLYIGALLHDIGKIGISEAIINKTDKLTNEEYQQIKTHPSRGALIIEPAKFLKEKVPLIKYHHERYDGKGYPEGLKGEEIPLMARIICCADSFDAMTSKRAYRDTMPLDYAKGEMTRCSGTQFDPEIVKAFLEVLEDEDKIKEIRNMK